MKREDFMPYNGKGPLPYKLNILGCLEPRAAFPSGPRANGEAWVIQPSLGATPSWSFLVFWDGTQFRVPKTPWVDVGCDRDGKVMYCVESSVLQMFLAS